MLILDSLFFFLLKVQEAPNFLCCIMFFFSTHSEHVWTDFTFNGRWRKRRKKLDYVDGCLTSIQMGVFQQVLYLFHTFIRFSLLGRQRKKKKKMYQPPPEEIWIVYVMKDTPDRLQYNFSWSRRYDAYALVKWDEMVRCAFLMVHLL